MAKTRGKSKPGKPRVGQKTKESRPARRRFFSFIVSPVIRRLILGTVVICLLYFWGAVVWEGMLTLFGLGLVILAVALGLLVWTIWTGKFSAMKDRWNWIVGGISLALAVWGILSFFTLGGAFGQGITGTSGVTGGLRVAGLIFLGIIFIAPRKCWAIVKSGWRAFVKLLRPRPRRIPSQPALPETMPREEAIVEVAPSAVSTSKASIDAERESRPVLISSSPVVASGSWRSQHEPILTPGGWQLPPIDILDNPTEIQLDKDDLDQRTRLIEDALSSYGVEARVVQVNGGPTVTQFGIEPGWDIKYREVREKSKDGTYETRREEVSRVRVRVDRITTLANDLALALASPSIRIEAPVPGKPVVGIEVPNTVFGSVALRNVIETNTFQKVKARSKLPVALGKGAGGEAVVGDLTKMPHLLIAGATGSGKTVCLNSIVCCLLLPNSPDDVRFIMIDPKRVELVTFNGIPHLLAPVIVDTDKAINSLRWLNQEMDNRYRQFAQAGARNIEGYNKDRAPGEALPYLVLIIDELADLMMASFDEVEHSLCRLAQLARATGIHLVVATQRPSVDVVTGLIKANFPTRISFAVTSQVDSRTILDSVGAEKLLGRGDMLYMPTEAAKPKRLQGTYVSDAELERMVYFWGNQRSLETTSVDFSELTEYLTSSHKLAPPPDALLEEAIRLAQEYGHISASFLQRRLRIGYPRAARLMETLEEAGLVETANPKDER